MYLTDKQKEFINYSNKTWNFKVGATRSGKTYIDFLYVIPARTRELSGKDGLYVIMGVSTQTIERNVLAPMRKKWGSKLVGHIVMGKGEVKLFNETYYVVGHEKSNAINRIQGSSIKYLYIDEIVRMNQSAFEMVKSRLDQDYSKCDATGNPEQPTHYIKKFIDEQLGHGDLYYQHYTIDDNPSLPQSFVERLKREYAGTVYYNRYILGQWALAEGAIYSMFKDNHVIDISKWNEKDSIGNYTHQIRRLNGFVNIGIDFGGNKSAHAFNCTWISINRQYVVTVKEKRITKEINPSELEHEFITFVQEVLDAGYKLNSIRADSAEQVLIRGLNNALLKAKILYRVKNALKTSVNGRIRTYQRLINTDRYYILDSCQDTIDAFKNAIWSPKTDSEGKDVRLDDGTTNIDSLDAQEYSTEEEHTKLIKE